MSATAATPVRIAQIGVIHPHAAGYRATFGLMPEIALIAAYDPDPTAAQHLLAAEGYELPIYDDIATMLARERPESVLINLPPATTPVAIVLAATAGCHIFAEKPCARAATEFLPAMAAIKQAGVQFATGYLRHCSPVALAIKQIVTEGLLGRLVSGEARLITTSVASRDPAHWLFHREQTGGGILGWLGCHLLDLLRWTTGSEVSQVAALLATTSGEAIDVEDTATVALEYTNGMLATVNCAYVTDGGINQSYFALRGSKGWLIWEQLGDELEVRSTDPRWAAAPNRTLRFAEDPTGGYGDAMGIAVFRHFIAGFRDGAPPPFVPADALRILEVLDAAREANDTGRRAAPVIH